MDEEVTVQNNWYTHLGVRLGASSEEAGAAYVAIVETYGRSSEEAELAREALVGLSHPQRRAYHDQQIKWDAARKWYRRRHPKGADRSAEYAYWGDLRRRVYGKGKSSSA